MKKSDIYKQSYLKKRIDANIMFITNKELELYFLNDTTIYVYEQFDGRKTVNEIMNSMHSIYDVDIITLEKDLSNVIDQLYERHLIEKV